MDCIRNHFESGSIHCEKWLEYCSSKKGNPGSVVVSLCETTRFTKEIDEAIESHGGWPDAFHGEGN